MLKLHGLNSQRISFFGIIFILMALSPTLQTPHLLNTHPLCRLLADMASNVLTDHKNLHADMVKVSCAKGGIK